MPPNTHPVRVEHVVGVLRVIIQRKKRMLVRRPVVFRWCPAQLPRTKGVRLVFAPTFTNFRTLLRSHEAIHPSIPIMVSCNPPRGTGRLRRKYVKCNGTCEPPASLMEPYERLICKALAKRGWHLSYVYLGPEKMAYQNHESHY